MAVTAENKVLSSRSTSVFSLFGGRISFSQFIEYTDIPTEFCNLRDSDAEKKTFYIWHKWNRLDAEKRSFTYFDQMEKTVYAPLPIS